MTTRASLAALAVVVATLFVVDFTNHPVGAAAPVKARFVDNGDGTVTDNQTRLMWEKKTVSNVNDTFTWSSTGSAPDGTLFTTFLATMDCVISYDGTCGLAGHADWRIPNIAELQTINDCTKPNCTDPIFGPTAVIYWSSTTNAGYAADAWVVDSRTVPSTHVGDGKANAFGARAVRGPF